MAHLFSDIRNMAWQTLYLNMVLIAPPRKNTSDHAELRILVTDPPLNGVHESGRVLVVGTSADGGVGRVAIPPED
jgi:hypothetical protein